MMKVFSLSPLSRIRKTGRSVLLALKGTCWGGGLLCEHRADGAQGGACRRYS